MKATRRGFLQAGAAIVATPAIAQSEPASDALTLWYRQAATQWTEALPVGNGRLGAMVFGGLGEERIQINEASLWGGSVHNYVNPDAHSRLERLRELIFAGRVAEAEKLTGEMMGQPPLLMPYQPFCDLRLIFEGDVAGTNYRRSLSLDEAVAAVTYDANGIGFRREVIVPHPDQVLAIRLTADRPGKQNVTIRLDSPHPKAMMESVGQDGLRLTGQIQPRDNPANSWSGSWKEPGLHYAAIARVFAEKGTVIAEGSSIKVRDADAVTILFSGATSFRTYKDIEGDAGRQAQHFLDRALGKSYSEMRARHLADHQAIFRRVDLKLGADSKAAYPTDIRIAGAKTADDPSLAALYFQFGRYLLIASSRPGGQPANLQGIWNERLLPPWGSKWTTNINLQMNYWLAENGAMWETLQPLWDLITDLQETGAQTARVHYGARGWVLHHNTDLWRATTPVDGPWGHWPMGAVWLAHQMWDHYRFSLDEQFLRSRAYPAMRGAMLFVLDSLVEAPTGTRFAGKLVTNPSFSPENSFMLNGQKALLTYGATMDLELIAALFESFVQASRQLSSDADIRTAVLQAKDRLPPLQVGSRGQLQEWIEDYPEAEPDHRHVSHLWALYPGQAISPIRTPALAAAARRSLELRGDAGTGWSKAWKIALWARLLDGDHAHLLLQSLLAESTLPNMFDTHPPFQIDGNFGAAAAIVEMLLQSGDDEIHLLPALPKAWPEGRVRGLRARGDLTLDIEWGGGHLSAAKLKSNRTRKVLIRHRERSVELNLIAGRQIQLTADLSIKS
jgi:alpha-L-fucosidase 2